jgi:hypothetical protein
MHEARGKGFLWRVERGKGRDRLARGGPPPIPAAAIPGDVDENDTEGHPGTKTTKARRGDMLVTIISDNDRKLLDVNIRHPAKTTITAIQSAHCASVATWRRANNDRPAPPKVERLDWTGKVVQHGEETKIELYTKKFVIDKLDVIPIAFDTCGFLCKRAREYYKKLAGTDMTKLIGVTTAALHRGNAIVLKVNRLRCYGNDGLR